MYAFCFLFTLSQLLPNNLTSLSRGASVAEKQTSARKRLTFPDGDDTSALVLSFLPSLAIHKHEEAFFCTIFSHLRFLGRYPLKKKFLLNRITPLLGLSKLHMRRIHLKSMFCSPFFFLCYNFWCSFLTVHLPLSVLMVTLFVYVSVALSAKGGEKKRPRSARAAAQQPA
jgi:hypothetical protein